MLVGAYVRYKIYNGSIRANILVVIGVFLKMISWMCLFMTIALLMYRNPNVEYNLSVSIPIIIGIGLISFIIGIFLSKKAEKVGSIDFKNKVKNDCEFAKKMAKLNEKNKAFYMELNHEYAEYVKSGHEELENTMEKSNRNKINDMIRNIVGFTLLILILGGMFYFIRSL